MGKLPTSLSSANGGKEPMNDGILSLCLKKIYLYMPAEKAYYNSKRNMLASIRYDKFPTRYYSTHQNWRQHSTK